MVVEVPEDFYKVSTVFTGYLAKSIYQAQGLEGPSRGKSCCRTWAGNEGLSTASEGTSIAGAAR